ncbi:hypothetical protein QJS10_CPB15g00451 [Acorus calamus]|uniref:Rhodanese domain-containing protein n=1 Tax=Acorus calamus TaxID=4465 RepID=A0AAV9D5N1_ACOCL|nr:hypothetical protein QJS10_CPB15g00451 [Acorus calamus]
MEEKKSSEAVKAIVTVNIHAARDLLHSGHIYLDVRMLEEFNIGHVENALNVPYYASVTPEGLSLLRDPNLVLHEFSGKGFKHVMNVAGGYSAWVDNGFDVEEGLA